MKLNPNSFFNGYFEEINLNDFFRRNGTPCNPTYQQEALNKLKFNTWGGYGERRDYMFRGSYLTREQNFTHLGIDINIKAGTPVCCPFDCQVVDIFIDKDTDIGWGTRLILKKRNSKSNLLLVIGHLERDFIYPFRQRNFGKRKNYFLKDDCLGRVGKMPTNGNVFHHIHVQAIKSENIKTFDGYGFDCDLVKNPNPFKVEW